MRRPIAATALLEPIPRNPTLPQSRGSVRREGGLRTTPFSDPNSPEATGGGSLGYNRALPHW